MLSPWQRITIAFLVLMTLFGVLISERRVLDAAEGEVASIEKLFGVEARNEVVDRATRWYIRVIVDSGFQDAVWKGYTRTPEQRARSPEFETGPFAEGLDWFEDRTRMFLTQILQVFLRLSAVVLWAPYMAILAVPVILEGWVRRRIKQANFAQTSTLGPRFSILLIKASMIGTGLLFLLPIRLPVGYIPAIGVLIALSLGLAVSNTQKSN